MTEAEKIAQAELDRIHPTIHDHEGFTVRKDPHWRPTARQRADAADYGRREVAAQPTVAPMQPGEWL